MILINRYFINAEVVYVACVSKGWCSLNISEIMEDNDSELWRIYLSVNGSIDSVEKISFLSNLSIDIGTQSFHPRKK